MTGFFFLVIRIFASPLVNLFQKKLINRGIDPVWIVLVAYIFFTALSVPFILITGPVDYPREFWIYMILLGVLDAAGNMFLVRSLKSLDLSVFGPMNAYKPVMALILSFFIVGEIPTIAGIAGVLVIISGSYLLHFPERKQGVSFGDFLKSEGIGFRFLSILLTSAAAVLSKKTIMLSSPLVTLSWWSVMGFPVIIALYLSGRRKRNSVNEPGPGTSVRDYIPLLLVFLILQVFSLYTFKYVLIGYSLALFQISAIISVFLGSRVFGEANIKIRYLASAIMILGACIIIFFG